MQQHPQMEAGQDDAAYQLQLQRMEDVRRTALALQQHAAEAAARSNLQQTQYIQAAPEIQEPDPADASTRIKVAGVHPRATTEEMVLNPLPCSGLRVEG
jgi:hypothetical protein